jgi:hypothetical protein
MVSFQVFPGCLNACVHLGLKPASFFVTISPPPLKTETSNKGKKFMPAFYNMRASLALKGRAQFTNLLNWGVILFFPCFSLFSLSNL